MRSANLTQMLAVAGAVKAGTCRVRPATIHDAAVRERVLAMAVEGQRAANDPEALVTVVPEQAPVSCIVADCAPNVALLEAALAEAGYVVSYTDRKHTVECRVTQGDSDLLVAYGLSSDRADALLHAMLGAVREFR